MSGGKDDPLGLEEKLDPWINRIYGISTVCGAIGGFIIGGTDPFSGGFWGRVFAAAAFAIGAPLAIGIFIFTPLQLIIWSIGEASKEKNHFKQGVVFILHITFFLGLLDFLLNRGTFIFFPFFHILFTGSLEGTFWMCDDWVAVEEGSYCADDN